MAPFVETEWGSEAFALMKEIKAIFDPEHLLNPGVILNPDPKAHLQHLKAMPAAHELIDGCTECGFCESHCPSKDLSLTPRQRITAYREIKRLERSEAETLLPQFLESFAYQAEATCATDSLCATACPMDIDTGQFIKVLRSEQNGAFAKGVASVLARHLDKVVWLGRGVLNAADAAHALLDSKTMTTFTTGLRQLSGERIPQWNTMMPKAAPRLSAPSALASASTDAARVVYVPSCISRLFGVARGDDSDAQTDIIPTLLERAGYEIIYPKRLGKLCCGMAFNSKGFPAQGEAKRLEMRQALFEASREGPDPIVMDTSPCFYYLLQGQEPELNNVHDPISFSHRYLLEKLELSPLPETVAIHTTCSAQKLGFSQKLHDIASACAHEVIVPELVGCCGVAGDRVFNVPELAESALLHLPEALPDDCSHGYSSSRTCEIGLSKASGLHYKSIFSLLEKASRPH